jgi:hypothetical protein
MFGDNGTMTRWCGSILLVLAAACSTEHNPLDCSDGMCGDPDHPFCDVNGDLGGIKHECIAPMCTPSAFGECRDDTEVRCNATGDDYDLTPCANGCDMALGGCRACAPGETVCANGTVQSCDDTGAVTTTQACPLGCFEDQPRCRDIDPSNGLATYLDMVANPPDLIIPDEASGASIGSDGTITYGPSNTMLEIPSFLASSGGQPLRVFVANRVEIDELTFFDGPAPIAIVATGDIVINADIQVSAGASADAACVGHDGTLEERTSPSIQNLVTASGGGGFATPGGHGGGPDDGFGSGVAGGGTIGTPELVPLHGGCRSGIFDGDDSYIGAGGGALQLSSRTKIDIEAKLDANGGDGFTGQDDSASGITGGGSGGGILLEAPIVIIGANGRLLAKGGGGCTAGTPVSETDDALPNLGVVCSAGLQHCGNAGNGAASGIAAQDGQSPTWQSTPAGNYVGGGGGGGLGRIRINTPDGSYTTANTSVVAGDTTTGTLSTR